MDVFTVVCACYLAQIIFIVDGTDSYVKSATSRFTECVAILRGDVFLGVTANRSSLCRDLLFHVEQGGHGELLHRRLPLIQSYFYHLRTYAVTFR